MQLNANAASLASRTTALPLARVDKFDTCKCRGVLPLRPIGELERARQAVLRASTGERIAWLAVALSALAALGVSLCF